MKTIAKAITGGLVAFAGTLTGATGDGHVTAVEWVYSLVAGLLAGFAVWEVPNTPAAEPPLILPTGTLTRWPTTASGDVTVTKVTPVGPPA